MNATRTMLIAQLTQQLTPIYHSRESAHSHALIILEFLLKKKPHELLFMNSLTLTPEQETQLADIVHDMTVNHKPLQYIIGSVPFLDLTIKVEPPILIPRPETEAWCADLIAQLKQEKTSPKKILDLCTGSGCIALALAQAFPHAHVTAIDLNPQALELAQTNKKINGITNCTFVLSDLYDALEQDADYDIIVTNPPYISETDWQQLEPSVKEWEDKRALVAPCNGLALITRILKESHEHLAKNIPFATPRLWIELGADQGAAALREAQKYGWVRSSILKDYAGHDRVLVVSDT